MRGNFAPTMMLFTLGIFSVPFLTTSPAQTQTAASPTTPPAISLHRKPIVAQVSEGGLWRVDGGFQTTIQIGNVVELAPITVNPILFMADGTEYPLAPISLGAAAVATINVNTALQSAPASIQGHLSTHGSVAVRYSWSWAPAIATSVRIFDDVRSLVYTQHLQLDAGKVQSPTAPHAEQTLEGMWWRHTPNMIGFVSVTNTSLNPVSANLAVYDSGMGHTINQPINLTPHSTEVLDLATIWNELPAAVAQGGITISYSGVIGSLVVGGGLEDDATGYSHTLRFTGKVISMDSNSNMPTMAPTPPAEITLASAGIMVGAQDADMQFPQGTRFTPYLVLRNTTTQPLQIQLSANYLSAGSSKDTALGGISIPALGIQQIDLTSKLAAAGLEDYNGFLNLSTSYQGQPGDLLEASGSIDQTSNYVFEVPAQREKWSPSRILNFWNTNGDNDTMVTLWNYSNKDEDLVLTLFHEKGQYKLRIHLATRASTTLSLATLIHSGNPDADGNVIPTNIVQGRAKLSGSQGNSERIEVAVSIAGYNVRTATCGCCWTFCDGVEDSWLDPSTASVAAGSTTWLTPTVEYYDSTEDSASATSWASTDTTVATVLNGGVTGVSGGNALISATSTSQYATNYGYFNDPEDCGDWWVGFPGEVSVTPVITSVSANAVMAGSSDIIITVSGTGFGSSPTVNLPTGVTVHSGSSQSSSNTSISLTIDVSLNATIRVDHITVTAGGQSSNQKSFTIDGPSFMLVVTDAIGYCSGCSSTQERDVTYQVVLLSNDDAGSLEISESAYFYGANCDQSFTYGTTSCGSLYTTLAGRFTDHWTIGSDVATPSGCGVSVSDEWMWCAPSTAKNFGSLSGFIHTNQIEINGYTSSVGSPNPMPTGLAIYP